MPQTHLVDAGALGEYTEVLMERGQAAADALLPEIAEHLEAGCVRCDADLDELVALLDEQDDAETGGAGPGAGSLAAWTTPPEPWAAASRAPAAPAYDDAREPAGSRGLAADDEDGGDRVDDEFMGKLAAARGHPAPPALSPGLRPSVQSPALPEDSGVFAADLPDARAVEAEAARRQRLRRLRDLLLIAAAVSILLLGLSLVGLAYVARQTQEPVRVPLMPQPGAAPGQTTAPAAQPGAPPASQPGAPPASQPGAAPGPAVVPASAGRAAPEGANCPTSHPIKGNRESMIYHLPGGSSYAATRPELCFAAPADAEADGYRRSQR